MKAFGQLSQDKIVFFLALALAVAFAISLPGFLSTGNLLNLVRSVSVLGILGVAMALVVIGRGVDLSIVATMAISIAWTLQLASSGTPLWQAALMGAGFSIAVGVINGILVAYVEIPSVFATLAMGTFVYGFGRYFLFSLDVVYLPESERHLVWLGQGNVLGMPVPIFIFSLVCGAGYLFLQHTNSGRYFRALGDNLPAARITGVPVRPVIVLKYTLSSMIGFTAGLVTAASVASMNTRVANSTLVYDIILVVVLGGIGLSGGRGGIRNVVVGTLLIGILLNGMTIMDIEYTMQNVIKGVILLTAIVLDTIINPRDEQIAQQGDI